MHPIYNTGVHRCTVYTIGVQLGIIYVPLRGVFAVFVIPGSGFALFGAWLCGIPGVWDAVVALCHQGVQLSNIPSPKAGICQSRGWNLVGITTFLAGFMTFGTIFLGRQSPWQRLVKRMTRFFTKLDADGSYRALKEVCEKMGYGWKMSCTNQVGIIGV